MVRKVAHIIEKAVHGISRVFNGIGVGILTLMMFFVTADVCLRYVFNSPILGAYEAIELMMAIVFCFGIAYTQKHKGHVSVSAVVSRFGKRKQAIIDSIVYFLSFGICFLLTWQTFLKARVVWLSGETTYGTVGPFGHVPVFPFVFPVGAAFSVLCLEFLVDFFASLTKAIRK